MPIFQSNLEPKPFLKLKPKLGRDGLNNPYQNQTVKSEINQSKAKLDHEVFS